MSAFLRKYGTGTGADVYIPVIKRGVVDFALSADWTPAAGDVKVSQDGGSAANIGTLPTAVTMGNTAMWKFVFTDAELQCKHLAVTVADSVTKAVEDQMLVIETYGHASAMHQFDLNTATQSVNVTQISGDSAAADNAESFFDGAGYGHVLVRTTIAGVSDQDDFLLSAGSSDNAAYNGCVIVIEDQSTPAQKAVGVILSYTGSTKRVLLLNNPSVFTIAAGDIVTILADRSLKPVTDNRVLDVTLGQYVAGAEFISNVVQANVTQISGDSTAADNAEAFFDGTGYAGTNNVIPTVTAVAGGVTVATNNDKTGYSLTAAERNSIADAGLDRADAIETGITPRLATRYIAAACAGTLSGAQTATEVFKGVGVATTRITAAVDSSGNRTTITLG